MWILRDGSAQRKSALNILPYLYVQSKHLLLLKAKNKECFSDEKLAIEAVKLHEPTS
jgi:hypothetical protein